MTICSGYFDASGKLSGFAAVTLGGFASPMKKWDAFDDAWQRALDTEGVKQFHATDFAASQGEFKAWKGDRQRRSRFVRSLLFAIKRNTNRMLSIGVEVPAWNEVNKKFCLEENFHSPYALSGYTALRLSSKWAHKKGHQWPIEVFFEDGDEDRGGLMALCWLHHRTEPVFLPKSKAQAFQAADMIAWKQRIAMTNAMRLEKQILADPDIETFRLIEKEVDSLLNYAPHSGDLLVYGKARLLQNCIENKIPKRSEIHLK